MGTLVEVGRNSGHLTTVRDCRPHTEAPLLCGLQPFLTLTLPRFSLQTSTCPLASSASSWLPHQPSVAASRLGRSRLMLWLVLSHLFHSVSAPTQVSATAAHTHLCLSLSLCGAEIIELNCCSCWERNHSFRDASLWSAGH